MAHFLNMVNNFIWYVLHQRNHMSNDAKDADYNSFLFLLSSALVAQADSTDEGLVISSHC